MAPSPAPPGWPAPYLRDGALLEWPRGEGQLGRAPQLLAWDLVDGAAGLLHRRHQALMGRLQLQGAQGLQGPGLVGLGQIPRGWRGWGWRAFTFQELGLPTQIVFLGIQVGPWDPCEEDRALTSHLHPTLPIQLGGLHMGGLCSHAPEFKASAAV